jgi:hypothetical protein
VNNKVYLKVLFTLLGAIAVMATVYVYYFSKNYPLPVTNYISLDAKIKFIRENIDVDKVDTLIVGSSLGLNNIQGEYVEKTSKYANHVLNISVYGSSATEIEQLLELTDAFPNLKRIIYSAQYSDFPHEWYYDNYHPKLLIKYIRDELNPLEHALLMFRACNNLFFCIQRQREWESKHMQNNKFEYLGFESTGSVPLHIYGDDIIGHRWRNAQPNIQNPKSFEAVDRMSKKAYEKGIKFYLVQGPYRAPLVKKHQFVRDALEYFAKTNREILKRNKGFFLSLHETLHLEDKYFADRTHLNDKGSILTAKAIGKFIDENEK